jgi:hypothetical protein
MKHTSEAESSAPRPWYLEGLRFQCTGCGNCCTGEPGYVWVCDEEIALLATELAMGVAEFEQAFTRRIGQSKSLIEWPNGDCVFFDNQTRRCTVYPWRPRQCRTWPFWESNLQTRRAWNQTCDACPGCGRGPVVPLDVVRSLMSVVKL